jgi:UDP-3-O-[3-hydroxymyristoyl] N-acetylglucosamine deacetylase
MKTVRHQKTVRKAEKFNGIGIHTGEEVCLSFSPAKAGQGIFFRRVDLQSQPIIPAAIEYVVDTARGTTLGIGDVKIHTVEHVLAALRAFDIDNVCVDLHGIEPPAGNGSSDVFVKMIEQAGVIELEATQPVAALKTPLWFSHNDVHLVALPSEIFRVSYTLHYPKNEAMGTQYFTFCLSQEGFTKEVAPCRTFSLYEELTYLMDRGLIRGGSLENAVVVHKGAIISKGGLYYPDEAVRHKVLDLIGDLSLVGIPFSAHVIALQSGHASNCAFAKKLYQNLTMENE